MDIEQLLHDIMYILYTDKVDNGETKNEMVKEMIQGYFSLKLQKEEKQNDRI